MNSVAHPSGEDRSANIPEEYSLRWINFLGRNTAILMQNANGPCPLLAVMNIQLLRNQIHFSNDQHSISSSNLLTEVTNALLDLNLKKVTNSKVSAGEGGSSVRTEKECMRETQMNFSLEALLEVLPSMLRGMNVNCRFSCPTAFEFTSEMALFDLLDISLVCCMVASQKIWSYYMHSRLSE
eukprot:Filipodium_phascolosomae@DN1524_c0_g1_i2.p1